MRVNKKFIVKRKIPLRKGLKGGAKRKKTSRVKNIIFPSTPVDFDVDFDTPPHLFAPLKVREKCDDLGDDPRETVHAESTEPKKNDQIAKDVELLGVQMEVDVATEREGNDNIQFLGKCAPELSTAMSLSEMETGENENRSNESSEISQERCDYNDGKKIVVLSVDILNSPQSNEILDSEFEPNDDTDGISDSQQNFHGSITEIENPIINIEELIDDGGNPAWKWIIEKYNQDRMMTKKNRKALNEAIIQYAQVKNIYLDIDIIENISFQICKIFPKEEPSSYFLKIGKSISGSLYQLYHRKRSDDFKERKERNRNEIDEITICEPTESIAILKSKGEEDNVYIKNWKETFEYRHQKLSEYDTYDDFINEWPIIATEIGYFLINLDFKKIHGDVGITSTNWNTFFTNNWAYLMRNVNDKARAFFKKVAKLEDSPAKDAALSMILHFVLPPAYGAAKWKPTCDDSQNTFLKFIKNQCIDQEIANRNKSCEERGIKWHPYIIGQGRSKRKINNFFVVIHTTKIKCENFLTALDMCLKIYILLDIPYPPESRAVWVLINRLFMNIKVYSKMTSRIFRVVSDTQ